MFRSYLPRLFGVLLFSLSCNPGNYEVTPCKPDILNLSQDICNSLNADRKDCNSIYQCDRATSSCKLSARDYDRDGDADATCVGSGGTDCNDFDPKVNGVNKTCSCDDKVGTDCSAGIGACQRSAKYSCMAGTTLSCTTPGPPMPNADYSADPVNGSYDLNCDGSIEMICNDVKGTMRSSCPAGGCDKSAYADAFRKAATQSDADAACSMYCGTFQASGLTDPLTACTQQKVILCDVSCGKSEFFCSCTVKDNGILANKTCISTGVVIQKVLCK